MTKNLKKKVNILFLNLTSITWIAVNGTTPIFNITANNRQGFFYKLTVNQSKSLKINFVCFN